MLRAGFVSLHQMGLLSHGGAGSSLLWFLLLQGTGSRGSGSSSCGTSLVAPQQVESFQARDQTHVPRIGRQNQPLGHRVSPNSPQVQSMVAEPKLKAPGSGSKSALTTGHTHRSSLPWSVAYARLFTAHRHLALERSSAETHLLSRKSTQQRKKQANIS